MLAMIDNELIQTSSIDRSGTLNVMQVFNECALNGRAGSSRLVNQPSTTRLRPHDLAR